MCLLTLRCRAQEHGPGLLGAKTHDKEPSCYMGPLIISIRVWRVYYSIILITSRRNDIGNYPGFSIMPSPLGENLRPVAQAGQ